MAKLTDISAQRIAEIEASSPCPTRKMLAEIQALEVKASTPSAVMAQVDDLEIKLPKDTE